MLKRTKHILLLLVSVLFINQLASQSAYSKFKVKSFKHKQYRSNIQIEPRLYYGFIINHHTELEPFNAHIPAFEISIVKDTYGRKYWEKLHNYPNIGVSFFFSTLANHTSVGQAVALYPFISFPIYRRDKDFLGFKLGLGLGYLTKTFDRLENYQNIAIGSHINVAVNLMGEYRRQLNEMTFISAGLSLIHFSNGSTATSAGAEILSVPFPSPLRNHPTIATTSIVIKKHQIYLATQLDRHQTSNIEHHTSKKPKPSNLG